MSPKKIIVFDLDGTLVDSSDNITRAINFVRNDSNLPPLDKDTITSNINRDDINPAKIFYEVDVFTARQRGLFETFYMDVCAEDLAHYEHIPQILEKLKSLGFSLSVATNGASHFANKMLSSLKLADFFDHLVGANNVSSPKPSPDMLHLILNEYGYSEIDFTPFLVGDSIKDIKAASSAGIKSAFATWGFGDDVDLADEKLQSAKEIERLLGHFGV